MATVRNSLPHTERTSTEPRENAIEPVLLTHIHEINPAIRLLRLTSPDPTHTIKFSPGQWLDTYIPGLRSAGGFTITSTPSQARPSPSQPAFLELAVQKSSNPPAQWLFRPREEILGAQLAVRVGGSFVWPPPIKGLDARGVERLVLVAGGVGINPLISIFSHLIRTSTATGAGRPKEIHFVYTSKVTVSFDPQEVLFLTRLMDLVAAARVQRDVTVSLFLTNAGDEGRIEDGRFPSRTFGRRVKEGDLVAAVDGYRGKGEVGSREGVVCYVCGPPKMTDEFVGILRGQEGMSEERVLCEKWW